MVEKEKDIVERLGLFGLHPDWKGDRHFSDAEDFRSDTELADAIAYVIGDLFCDCRIQSPVEQWKQVVKALRFHKLAICNEDEIERLRELWIEAQSRLGKAQAEIERLAARQ